MLKQDGAKPIPFFYVGRTITNERVSRFSENKHALLSKQLGKPETQSVWYTREHIELLLEEINHAGADGLRIYLGEYGEEENYSGQLCLLMVMTKEGADKDTHNDIIMENTADFQARSLDGNKPRSFNVGSPCPPICNVGISYPQ
jgi:hypothetical protein